MEDHIRCSSRGTDGGIRRSRRRRNGEVNTAANAGDFTLHPCPAYVSLDLTTTLFLKEARLMRYFSDNLNLRVDNMEPASELMHQVGNRIAAAKMPKASIFSRGA